VAGPLPDLRYSSKEVLESMEPIVLGGSRAADGMPSFQKILTSKEVQAIRSYIIARAQESAKPTQASEQR
jgi:mono/diheme cytochrome c family protein